MAINYNPFESQSGFTSPGFTVDELGNIVTTGITTTGTGTATFAAAEFTSILNLGNLISSGVDADIQLNPTGTGSVSISPVTVTGIISNMNINAVNFSVSNTINLNTSGSITINPSATGSLTINPSNTGIINNVNIGSIIPGTANFSNLTANDVNADMGSIDLLNDTELGTVVPRNAGFLTATAENNPTEQNHLTRKNYVDTKATALAIALGA